MSLSARVAFALACALPAAARAEESVKAGQEASAKAGQEASAKASTTASATIEKQGPDQAGPSMDLRLTLSTFLYRETGGEGPPLIEMGAPVASASPVRRYFSDLRLELTGSGLELDTRVRQTTSEQYQSGASGGAEYEVRKLAYRLGGGRTQLVLGRQFVDAVGATKIDGAALIRRVSKTWSATLFGGAFPALGSRSLDTDYPRLRTTDGTSGSPIIPFGGGGGASYSAGNVHGDLGAAAVYVTQDEHIAHPPEPSRVYFTANGYARVARWLNVYHAGLLDITGMPRVRNLGTQLTSGNVGIDARPGSSLQLSAQVLHVSTELLQIAARNTLDDPDPTAVGIVQNNTSVVRVSQDQVRGTASVALARARFELSLSGGLHRRPGVTVALADGSTAAFPKARSASVTFGVLDRRSIAKLRLSATGTLIYPIGSDVPNRSRGSIVRLAASRAFADARGQLEADAMAERFRDLSGGGACEMSLDALACYGAARTSAAQVGALVSWRIAREWLVLADAHLGLRDVTSTSINNGTIDYPIATSVTAFARVQWRYR